MATVTKYLSSLAAGGSGVTNPNNALGAPDTLVATGSPARSTNVLQGYLFPNFTTSDIPDNAVITNVQMQINASSNAYVAGSVVTTIIAYYSNFTIAGTNDLPVSSLTTYSYNIPNVTIAQLRNASSSSNFEAYFQVSRGATSTTITGSIEWASLVVTYTAPVTTQASFTGSAIKLTVNNKSFAISSIIKNSFVNSFTVNALFPYYNAFQSTAFQTNAFQANVKPYFTKNSSTANSVIKKTIAGFLKIDSFLIKIPSSSFGINSFKNNVFYANAGIKRNINSSFDIYYQWGSTSDAVKYGKFLLRAEKNRKRTLFLYSNEGVSKSLKNRALYTNSNSGVKATRSNSSLYEYSNLYLPVTTVTKSVLIEAEYSTAFRSSTFTADAWIQPTFGEPFDMDAYIRTPTNTSSFTVNSATSKVGEKRGFYSINWNILSHVEKAFGASGYIVTWRQKPFFINSFFLGWFTINGFVCGGSSFTINARIGNLKTTTVGSWIKKTKIANNIPASVASFPMTDAFGSSSLKETVGLKNAALSNPSGIVLGSSVNGFSGAAWSSGYASTSFYQPSTSEVSIEFFIKTTVDNGEIWNGRSGTNGSTNGQGLSVSVGSVWNNSFVGTLDFFLNSDNVWNGAHTSIKINDGVLHHVLCVWKGTAGVAFNINQLSVYIDGSSVALVDDGAYNTLTAPLTGNTNGATFGGYTYGQYTGFLSNLVFYKYAFTQSEAYYLANVRWSSFNYIAPFTVDANKVSLTGAGNRWKSSTINGVIKSSSSKRFRLFAQLTLAKPFSLNAFVALYKTMDAWIATKGGGMDGFGINAYIKTKPKVIVFDDNGNPTIPNGLPPEKKYEIKIMIGIKHPELFNLENYKYWYNKVAAIEHYINQYSNIPENKRTAKQQAALDRDLYFLSKQMPKLRIAQEIPVEWIDYTNKAIWSEASFTQSARVGAGSFNLSLKGSFPEIKGGEEIRVEIDGFRIFGGYITQIEQTYFFPYGYGKPKTILHGTDYNALFDRLVIYNLPSVFDAYYKYATHMGEYQSPNFYAKGTSDDDIIVDVAERYMIKDFPYDLDYKSFVDAVDTPAPVSGWMLPESGSSWRIMMQSITTITNALFYIDPCKVLHYHDRSKVTAPYAITDGVGGTSCRDLVITQDISQMKNDVLVWGTLAKTVSGEITYWRETDDGKSAQRFWKSKVDYANKVLKKYKTIGISNLTNAQKQMYEKYTNLVVYYNDKLNYAIANPGFDAVAKFGRWQLPEFRTDIHSDKWVLKRARAVVARYGQPIITASATVFDPGLIAGQVVTLKSSAYGITADLAIRSMTITFPVSKGGSGGKFYTVPKYDLVMGLDPETGWDIYDYLPFEGINTGYKAK